LITDERCRIALSNLGWVDHGSLWRFDAASGRVDSIRLSGAGYLVLQGTDGDEFTVVHHFGGSRVEITAHPFSAPAHVLRRVIVTGWAPRVDAGLGSWPSAVCRFVAWLDDNATGSAGYFLISVTGTDARIERLDWFDASSYDLGYQSVLAVQEVPGTGELVFGIQRSSHLAVTTPGHGGAVRQIGLGGRYGNAIPHLRRTASEVWAVDYDTLVRLDWRTWDVTGTIRLYDAPAGTAMFTGDVWLPPDEALAVVPRPGMADIAVVDPQTMTLIRTCHLGRQPLVAVVADGGHVVARDWKTGDLLRADLT